jgi:hypothetical protein
MRLFKTQITGDRPENAPIRNAEAVHSDGKTPIRNRSTGLGLLHHQRLIGIIDGSVR